MMNGAFLAQSIRGIVMDVEKIIVESVVQSGNVTCATNLFVKGAIQ